MHLGTLRQSVAVDFDAETGSLGQAKAPVFVFERLGDDVPDIMVIMAVDRVPDGGRAGREMENRGR